MTFVARLGTFYIPESRDNAVRFSSDGRWLAFSSFAGDLVPGQRGNPDQPSGSSNIFLWDRTTGSILLVSRLTTGPTVAGNGYSTSAALSADGRYVAFLSYATDLVTGQIDGPFEADVFLFDRITGGMALVSHARGSAVTSAGTNTAPVLSADGRFVAFASETGDLDPNVTPRGDSSVYLYDRTLGTHQRAGFNSSFQQQLALSADGSVLLFLSTDDVIPGVSFSGYQLYLYDLAAKSVTLVSRDASYPNRGGLGDSDSPAVSADGRYTAFTSDATNLVAGEITPLGWDGTDVFLFDRVSGTAALLRAGGKGRPWRRPGTPPCL